MRTWIGITVVALGLVAGAGCGGDDGADALTRDAYQAEVIAAGEQVAAQFEEIAIEARSLSTSEISSLDDSSAVFQDLADVVAGGEGELRSFAERLDGLEPPDDARTANDELVEGFTQLADDFAELGAALEEGEISQVTELAGQLEAIASSEAGATIQSAIDELEATGYSFDAEP